MTHPTRTPSPKCHHTQPAPVAGFRLPKENTHCQLERGSKPCGKALVLVPDHDGKGVTICCPRCDDVDVWPPRDKRKTKRS